MKDPEDMPGIRNSQLSFLPQEVISVEEKMEDSISDGVVKEESPDEVCGLSTMVHEATNIAISEEVVKTEDNYVVDTCKEVIKALLSDLEMDETGGTAACITAAVTESIVSPSSHIVSSTIRSANLNNIIDSGQEESMESSKEDWRRLDELVLPIDRNEELMAASEEICPLSIPNHMVSPANSSCSGCSRSSKASPSVSPIKPASPIEWKRLDLEDEVANITEVTGEEEEDGSIEVTDPFTFPDYLLKSCDGQESNGAVSLKVSMTTLLNGDELHSKLIWMKALPWCLYVKTEGTPPNMFVSVYLKCPFKSEESFTCRTHMNFILHHASDTRKDMCRSTSHLLNQRENDWGWKHFRNVDTITEGEFMKDGIIFLSCSFHIGDPQGMSFLDHRTRVPVGLVNQGATCYMNAAIHILFSTNILRKVILGMDCSGEGSKVMKALQKLFYKLHTSTEAVSTEELTDAFGWKNTWNAFAQHDVQEMMKLLLDRIEKAFKGTENESLVEDLFKTKTRTFIRCMDVDFESTRDEFCTDIQLPVSQTGWSQPYDIVTALREITRTEILDGDNKYYAEGHGLQRAEKGQKFLSFPKVLHLQLLRFQLDWMTGDYVKVNGRVEFSEILNLGEFVEDEEEKERSEYALHGVVAHSGSAGSGHYVAYVCKHPGHPQPRWFKLDDATSTEIMSSSQVIYANFGNGSSSAGSFNAYMLTYIRTDSVDEVMCNVSLSDISRQLRDEITSREEMQKLNRMNYMPKNPSTRRIKFAMEPDYMTSLVWDFFDFKQWENGSYQLEVGEDDNALQLLYEARKHASVGDVRLFVVRRKTEDDLSVMRVDREVDVDTTTLQMRRVGGMIKTDEECIFIQKSRPLSFDYLYPNEKKEGIEITIYVKYYNGNEHSTRYVAPFKVMEKVRMRYLSQVLSRAVHLPYDSHLKYWKEESPCRLVEIDENVKSSLKMGDIIVFESRHLIRKDRSIESLLVDSRRIRVTLKSSSKGPFCAPIENKQKDKRIEVFLSMASKVVDLVKKLGDAIDHPADQILLWNKEKMVKSSEMEMKVSNLITSTQKEDPRCNYEVYLEFMRLEDALDRVEDKVMVTVCTYVQGDAVHLPFTLNRNENLSSQVIAMLPGEAITNSLRFVWRRRQSAGFFMFRQLRGDEDMMEMIKSARTEEALTLCVLMRTKEEMESSSLFIHNFAIPVMIVETKNPRSFPNLVTSTFVQGREGMDMFDLKTAVTMAIERYIDWDNEDLLLFLGSKLVNLGTSCGKVDFIKWYREVGEDEIGLNERTETKVVLALYSPPKTTAVEHNQSQSIVIQD